MADSPGRSFDRKRKREWGKLEHIDTISQSIRQPLSPSTDGICLPVCLSGYKWNSRRSANHKQPFFDSALAFIPTMSSAGAFNHLLVNVWRRSDTLKHWRQLTIFTFSKTLNVLPVHIFVFTSPATHLLRLLITNDTVLIN